MVQASLHSGTSQADDYNPEQAGNQAPNADGSVVLSAACSSNAATIISGTTWYENDYSSNANLRARSVQQGRVRAPWATPYVITNYVSWVTNPTYTSPGQGVPRYYLQIDQYVTNVDNTPSENFSWYFEEAAYFASGLSTTASLAVDSNGNAIDCTSSLCTDPVHVRYMLAGGYTDATKTVGAAEGIRSSQYWTSGVLSMQPVSVSANSTDVHIANASIGIPPGTTKHTVYYIMVGPWQNAKLFMEQN